MRMKARPEASSFKVLGKKVKKKTNCHFGKKIKKREKELGAFL